LGGDADAGTGSGNGEGYAMSACMLRLGSEVELLALQRRMGGSPPPRTIDTRPLEKDVQSACLEVLALHPGVAWFHRMNVGAIELDHRLIRFAFTGCSDVLGQLTRAHGGRTLAVEFKRPHEQPTDDQAEFLWKVHQAGGCAFVASDTADIFRNIPR
jgi:hypothetical protein